MKTIAVCAQSLSPELKATFDALGEALGVSFERRQFEDDRSVDAWLVLQADRKLASRIDAVTRPCYVVLDDAELIPRGTSSTLTYANRSELPPVLRGRVVTADDAAPAKTMPQWLKKVVPLAFKEGSPVWATRPDDHVRHDYVSLLPPALESGEPLFAHFSGQRLACLLPLVLFTLSLTRDEGWDLPPLQASMMFDDPNLHWPSYGFIDYGEMVRRAAASNYHVAIATIPLDAWFAHRSTVGIFKANTNRISLLYHGNDHVSQELGRATSSEAMRRLLHQAVVRISGMEARTGLDVARVMAPPHGACSETAISEMARLGFEALCVSRGSLRFHNPDAAWTRTIGMKPCDVVAGLPIVPRFGLSAACRNDILIAALLRQPIVPITHHQGVADGYALLDEIASFVNSLGEVRWSGMKDISRSLYARKQDGGTLRVRMFSKHVRVRVSAATTRIQVERSWLSESSLEPLLWRPMAMDRPWTVASDPESIPVLAGTTIELASRSADETRGETPGTGLRRLAPVARRILTEGRDRALPSIQRIARRERSPRLS